MKLINLVLFDAKPYDKEFFDLLNNEGRFKIKYFESKLRAETVSLARGADAVCGFVNDNFDEEVIDRLSELGIGIIALRCAGFNNVNLKAAKGKIKVVRVPAYSPHAVAEYAVALIMALNRKIHRAYYRVRDNNFNISGLTGFDLYQKTAGIIGTGKIGCMLIRILKGFGMNVIAYDAYPNYELAQKEGFQYVEKLEYLYRQSDIISLHCPLTPHTHDLINRESIALMKSNVMIINTGRGGLIDTHALIRALKSKRIGSAGLDVYEEEGSWFFEDFSVEGIHDDVLARLLTFPNVLITSHQAFLTQEALRNIAETTLQNLKDWFDKGEPVNEVLYQRENS